MTLVDDLARRIARIRADYLDLERAADDGFDDELDGRVAIARLALLDVADRIDQLREIDLELDQATT